MLPRSLKKLWKYIKADKLFSLTILMVIILAVCLRGWDYFDRIYIHADHSLFAQGAIYAWKNLTLPQIGPFAQAPFFTGPWWLIILAIFFLVPLGYLTPWLMMSLLSLVFIYLIFYLGREIGGKWLGAVAALIAAVSYAQLDNSFGIWNAAADPIMGLLAMIFLVRFYKTKKPIFIFLVGFTISLATTIHFQTFLLSPIIIVALITSRFKIKNFLYLLLGLIIPLLPYLFFDLRFGWFWIRSVYIYVTIDRFRFWVPNRWLTYAFDYWPSTWAYILGLGKIWGFILIFLLSILTVWRLRDARHYKIYFLVALSFFLEVVLFRYWQGERFIYYSNFAQAAVIILTAWVVFEIVKLNKFVGLAFLVVIALLSFKTSVGNLKPRDITLSHIKEIKNEIYAMYPSDNFDIWGCSYTGALISHPLAYMMYVDHRNKEDGLKIGVCYLQDKTLSWEKIADESVIGEGSPWLQHSTEMTYKTMVEWWKENPPK